MLSLDNQTVSLVYQTVSYDAALYINDYQVVSLENHYFIRLYHFELFEHGRLEVTWKRPQNFDGTVYYLFISGSRN